MEARNLRADPHVVEVNDRAAFMSLEAEWNRLVETTSNELFYRHEFLRLWLDNFAAGSRMRVLLLRGPDGELSAALPLVEERTSMYGMPVRQLTSAANAHSCRFDLLASDPELAADAFLTHLKQTGGWDVLRLTDVPEGGVGFRLVDEAKRRGLPVGGWESLQSPYVTLPAKKDAYFASLPSKFKANCRRRRRKLEEKGKVTFECVTGGLDLEGSLEEGLLLEQSGWKGQRGTAMAQDGKTRGFYTELARDAAYRGRLALYFLRLDGRAVAFQYGLEYGKRYFLLKPGYDESLKECSPGQLLMEEVLGACLDRGLTEFDFLGPDMVWKRDWTHEVRKHTWLYVFNDTAFSRALCATKFRWVPAAKEAVARWKR
ncbi:GNAT family N-acetyltransferase [Corallococcus praedator]|uniref:GNAT family N-acetyltransferase n=1 Tax=Corallococcus praedator TaxID=2316724 RepID=A0ABX9QMU5_9BACT|nr:MULTISPECIES: GNAT family N-acetyltransferase [Corallococcus]RKH18181.1 GNAT family N-acetyltransferase [Corallococcus sp. CA047B]RKH35109.1 GNAT family N-acetyltransferase [Corallococcus sp. CA031C]RKI10870.1 GNAT family N-acetyltransferase [Corallococcus praedator]